MKKHSVPFFSSLFLFLLLHAAAFICCDAAEKTTIKEKQMKTEKPYTIGSKRELFLDSTHIHKATGKVRLTLNKPRMKEIVLTHNKPWEGNVCGYNTIFKDGNIFRMYYRGWHFIQKGPTVTDGHEDHPPVVCYAESKDGIHWKKPGLGICEFRGSTKNNIIWTGTGSHNFVPFLDTNPDCKPSGRYKAIGGLHRDGGLFAFQSPDGLHWKKKKSTPVITSSKFAFDSQNLVFWDKNISRYRVYFRVWPGLDRKKKQYGHRDIATATSSDFVNWSQPVVLTYPGVPTEHLYVNQIQPYYRAPHIYIGFPVRYVQERDQMVEGLFMTSRDGKVFNRWQEAIIRPGLNQDRWHNRSNYIWCGVIETKSSLPGSPPELSIFTNERYYKGKWAKTRRFTYRVDGFTSMQAGYKGGSFVTTPLIFSGSELHVNLSTSVAGSMRVEIQDKTGKAFKGFSLRECPEIYGDFIDHTVQWKSGTSVKRLAGKSVRLKFVLKDADLYSYIFK